MPHPTFTLASLGTATVFNPLLKKITSDKSRITDFPKGELLSVVATLIKTAKAPILSPAQIAYQADEVAVINGPSAVGTNIKIIIGYGLALVLKAITEGRTISLIGHSRGAVESLLIAHEVQVIQKIIQSNPSVTFERLMNTLEAQGKSRGTGAFSRLYNTGCIIQYLKELLPQTPEEQDHWLQHLKSHIDCKLSLFLIDPVPGEAPFYWWDKRFCTLPEIVEKSITLFCDKERSYGFAVINPIPEKPSELHQKLTIPAHHGGISSGNNASQQKKLYAGTTTHPHKFGFFKLLEFLFKSGVQFNEERIQTVFEPGRAMGRRALNFLHGRNDQPIRVEDIDFDRVLKKLYDLMQKHSKDYEAIKASNYAYIYRSSKRYIVANDGYHDFEKVFPPTSGYINTEHQQLTKEHLSVLCGKLHLNESEDLGTFLTQFTKAIATKLSDKSLSDENSADFVEIIKICFAEASQKYLMDIGDDLEKSAQKKLLYKQIRTALLEISALSHPITSLIKSEGVSVIERTLKEQAHQIKGHLNTLLEPIENKLKYFFIPIISQINRFENKELNPDISEILQLNEFKALRNHPLTDKIQFICKQLYQKQTQQPLELLLTAGEKSQALSSLSELEALSISLIQHAPASTQLTSSDSLTDIPSSPGSLDSMGTYPSRDSLEPISPASADLIPHALPINPSAQEEIQPMQIQSRRFIEPSQIAYLINLFEKQYPPQCLDNFKALFAKINTLILDIRTIRHLFLEHRANAQKLGEYELKLHDQKEILAKTVVQSFSPTSSTALSEFSDSFEKHCERREAIYIQDIEDKKQLHAHYQKIIKDKEQKSAQLSQDLLDSQVTQALTEEEARYFLLIEDKIEPLTKSYNEYLAQLLKNTPEAQKKPIEHKMEIVDELLNCLKNMPPKPAKQRLENFFQTLNQAHNTMNQAKGDILKQHRDPQWARFRYNIYKALGLLIGLFTVVPLLIYTKSGNSFSFWQSKGEKFVKEVGKFQPSCLRGNEG